MLWISMTIYYLQDVNNCYVKITQSVILLDDSPDIVDTVTDSYWLMYPVLLPERIQFISLQYLRYLLKTEEINEHSHRIVT